MMVYLAGPIDLAPAKGQWREEVARKLAEYGISSFDPAAPYTLARDGGGHADVAIARKIFEINTVALQQCDLFLGAFYTASIGTPMELREAKKMNKPTVCVWSDEVKPPPLYLIYHADYIVSSYEEAVNVVVAILLGEKG